MSFQQAAEPMYNFRMTQRIRLVALALILASILDPARAAPARAESLPQPLTATAYELIDAVNRYRGQNGLPAYSISSILMGTAQNQAAYMASTGNVTHTGPGGISFPDRLTAAGYSFVFRSENIISGSPDATGWDLVNSPSWADSLHQHTMLSPDLCEIGAGVSVSGGRAYYVIDCACPSGSSGTGGSTPVPGATSSGGGGVVSTLATVIPNTPKPDGSISHIVRPGETLWSIAIAYQTTIAELKSLNNLQTDEIYPNQTLQISPPASTQTPAPTSTGTPVPTATPFVFRTATSPPEPTVSPIPSAPVTGGSGVVVVGSIIIAALISAGALTAAGARKSRDNPRG
ncbi:MAG: LysM peptidoglycan-binding domain-containing protein [Anaerolineaceae bacterium]|nr:MAG: LysM peptidoglycan-binding domain-containing protein [Anaerolineaceae bacterium]